jgi:hypothetical protein
MGMSFEFDEDDGEFSVNYAKVLHENNFLPVTRLLAADLMKSQYMSVGDFLQNLSVDTLSQLTEISENENDPHFEEVVLITEMLAAAEGTNIGGAPEVHQRLNLFITWLVVESLRRKGLVKVYYENISFGEDMADKIIVEKIK